MIVVSDSTMLIGLAKLGKLDLLPKVFPKIYIPGEVFRELVDKGKRKPGSEKIKKVKKLNGLNRRSSRIGLWLTC